MDGMQPHYAQGQEGRREEHGQMEAQYHPPAQPIYPAQTARSPPPPNSNSSPFAFAPPPLSTHHSHDQGQSSRPPLPFHHSEPITQPYNHYKPPMAPHHSFPTYPGSAPLGYRSLSGENRPQPRPGPSNQPDSPYSYQPYSVPQPRQNIYPQGPPNYYGSPYGPPAGSSDMPRSLSYNSLPHHPYQYTPYSPMPAPTAMSRNNSNTGDRPSLGYSFANRLPLVERPFKCDECVQSFNRNHDLKRHKRIHLSVKPFGCDKCGKTFSRKDALRRHWLVKGCRGDEGATAPIVPLFPINSSAHTPPTPTTNSSPVDGQPPPHSFPSTMSYGHPSAPPPLTTLPTRESSDHSQIIVTPNDPQLSARAAPLEEPMPIDPNYSADARASTGSEGYFEGVVGLKSDGTAVLEKHQTHYDQYQRYRNPSTQDEKPVFVAPFNQLYPENVKMEKQSSHMSQPSEDYQPSKWHRPSFPFPPVQGNVYNSIDSTSPVDAVGPQHMMQGYAQA